MEQDKRQAPRIEKMLVAQYCQDSEQPSCWDTTAIKNISTKGIFLFTNKSFAKDEIIRLLIKIPFDPFHWMEVKGKVIESLTNTTRIMFIELTAEQEKLIHDYVEWLIKSNPSEKH